MDILAPKVTARNRFEIWKLTFRPLASCGNALFWENADISSMFSNVDILSTLSSVSDGFKQLCLFTSGHVRCVSSLTRIFRALSNIFDRLKQSCLFSSGHAHCIFILTRKFRAFSSVFKNLLVHQCTCALHPWRRENVSSVVECLRVFEAILPVHYWTCTPDYRDPQNILLDDESK